MAQAHCLTKPHGRMLIGVPSAPKDMLLFNAARVYGPVMFKHLFANWRQVHADLDYRRRYNPKVKYEYQPLFVLEKM